MKVRVRESQGQRPGVCVYCRDALELADVLVCTGCGAALHAACWGDVRECPSIGCELGVPAGAKEREGCISCLAPLPEGESGACATCRRQHEEAWSHDDVCPRCRLDLSSGATAACEGCGTALHIECWKPLSRCLSPGCGFENPHYSYWATATHPSNTTWAEVLGDVAKIGLWVLLAFGLILTIGALFNR